MAYRVLCDGFPLYDLRSDELVLTAPKVKLSDNSAGSLSFVITPDHPNYSQIKKLKSVIQVFQDDDEIFSGRVTEEKKDFYNQKNVYCEGELNYLVDSVQRPAEYHDQTVRGFLQTLLNIHNAQVEASKQFFVGAVTVTDPNDSLYRYTNYENTLNCISEKLVKRLGGHLRIRKVNGVRYLDYLEDYPITSDQVIEFGTNLLDYSENTDASDIATAVIPLGARLDEGDKAIAALNERITIKAVNNGSDYLFSQAAVEQYGWVFKTVIFDEVNVPANLKTKGQAYLNDIQFEQMTLDVTAVDLHDMGVDIEKIGMLNKVRVKSAPHGLDRFFPVTEMEISIDAPENNTLRLGEEKTATMTTTSASSNSDIIKKIESIPSESKILKEAQDNATQLIHSATNGHVVTTAEEQLIMDTDDKETANKIWRWNLNGLGYSNTGYEGQYNTAITMDGQIVGERLVGGSVSAEKLDINYRSEIEKKIEIAEENANDATDSKLSSYWTKVQVETAIKNTGDFVLLLANETSKNYVNNELSNYATSSQLELSTQNILLQVSETYATQDSLGNYTKTSEIRSKFALDSSSVTIESGIVTFNSNTLVINSTNFKLTNSGTVSATGVFKSEQNRTDGQVLYAILEGRGIFNYSRAQADPEGSETHCVAINSIKGKASGFVGIYEKGTLGVLITPGMGQGVRVCSADGTKTVFYANRDSAGNGAFGINNSQGINCIGASVDANGNGRLNVYGNQRNPTFQIMSNDTNGTNLLLRRVNSNPIMHVFESSSGASIWLYDAEGKASNAIIENQNGDNVGRFNKLGINGSAEQTVNWVWSATLGGWLLTTSASLK